VRYSILGVSMLNFCKFARYSAIGKIACYIALKHHNVAAILDIARYFFDSWYKVSNHTMRVWSKRTYDANLDW
jgi:hypothetical protein